MYKKEEKKKQHVMIGTIGHVDYPKSILTAVEEKYSSTNDVIEEAKDYIKPETLKIWEEFSKEYEFFYSGLFIKRLVVILKLLHEEISIKEIEEYLNKIPLNKELINYICIALIRFSDRGFEFYEKFYIIDIPEDKSEILNEYENAMCRMLAKKTK